MRIVRFISSFVFRFSSFWRRSYENQLSLLGKDSAADIFVFGHFDQNTKNEKCNEPDKSQKIWKDIHLFFWNYLVKSTQNWRFFQIFVTFSEYLNFRSLQILDTISSWCDERKLLDPDLFSLYPGKISKNERVNISHGDTIIFELKADNYKGFTKQYSISGLLHIIPKFSLQYYWNRPLSFEGRKIWKKISYSFLKLPCNVITKWEIFFFAFSEHLNFMDVRF